MFKVFLLIFFAYVIYFLLLPPLQVNDEPEHIKIIASLSNGKYPLLPDNQTFEKRLPAIQKLERSINFHDKPDQLPNFENVFSLHGNKNDWETTSVFPYEAHYPPIYYLTGVPFFYVSKISQSIYIQYYILRLVSAFYYFAVVFISWKILLLLFNNKKSSSSILLLFSINPLVIKMGIGINPDISTTFFSLTFLYLMLISFRKKPENKKTGILSVTSALSTLTKISGIFTNLSFIVYFFIKNGVKKKSITGIFIFELLFSLLVFPWLIFMFYRYNTFFPEPFTLACGTISGGFSIQNVINFLTPFRHSFMHYSGFMGWGWPHPFSWFFISYVILMVTLILFGVLKMFKSKSGKNKIIIIFTFSLFFILFILSTLQKISNLDCDIQGRYLLPVFLPLCVIMFYGLKSYLKKELTVALVFSSFAIFHYLFILFSVIILRYYV